MAQSGSAATTITAPGFLPRTVKRDWISLGSRVLGDNGLSAFDEDALPSLPEPAARWLRHVIAPGAPLCGGTRLSMHGTIRIGTWRPFTARQIVTPEGFIWAADAGRFPMRVKGFDRLVAGVGEMRWRLFGLVPVMTAAEPDTTRSAAGRLAGEGLVLVPGAALSSGVTWRGLDEHRAIATVSGSRFAHEIEIDVDDRGSLRKVSFPRWGNPDGGSFAYHRFTVTFDSEATFGGYILPRVFRAAWQIGNSDSNGEFFRCAIDRAEFF